jgi:hypothetical protein|tara:strand:- start:14 stop:550 length:537 start_codon:yes stop_codon:yes gene_type:complete
MELTKINNYLYQVSNIVPDHISKDISEIILPYYESNKAQWSTQEAQEDFKRTMTTAHPLCAIVEESIRHELPYINETLGYKWNDVAGTRFWLDFPGFKCPLHLDGDLPIAMQLFWTGERATSFYNSNNENDLLFEFPMTPNTGYLMLNPVPTENTLWHGMCHTTTLTRLSSYTYFVKD